MALPKPFVVVFAGPNGSGKSSLTRELQARGYELGSYINPDDIAAELSGSYEDRVRRAQAIADAHRAEAIESRKSFSFETVFSHSSKLDVLDQARLAGFDVLLFFVGLDDPLLNVERVSTRVQSGGHDVPADRIVARYHRTMTMLPDMIERIDRAWIFDNTVRAVSATQFAGRLVADAQRRNSTILVTLHYPVPDWVERYLAEPLRSRPAFAVASAR
jgi:predicted ABC-type ATPase